MSYFSEMFKAKPNTVGEYHWFVNDEGEITVFEVVDGKRADMVCMVDQCDTKEWLSWSGMPIMPPPTVGDFDPTAATWQELLDVLNAGEKDKSKRTERWRRIKWIVCHWCPYSFLRWDDDKGEWVLGSEIENMPLDGD